MADQRTINVGLSFTADTTKARQELAKLKDDLTKTISTSKIGQDTTAQFDEAIKRASQLRGILEGATSATGDFNLTKFRNELDRSGMTMQQVFTSLKEIGATDVFNDLAAQIQNSNSRANILSGTLKKFAQGLMNTAMWTIQSNAIHAVEGALSSAYGYAQKLNKGLTDIAIVSDLNTQQLTEFARTANKMAQELSSSTADYVSGALIYYQAGLSDEEVIERTNTTIKLAQTSGESAEAISSYMTAIWNNFYDGSKSVEYYADAISYLGAVTAASNADIAEGMQSFAAVADTVGLSFEYGASALTLLRDITQQSASTIGNSLKTIFARLSSVAQGDTLEDGVDLTKYSKALNQVGVSVLDVNGNLRDMDSILDDLGARWDSLGNAQKVALAQTVGGVRQYNNLISLMDNYERFQELTSEAAGSEGYLNHQAEIYADSWEAAGNRLQAAWQKIYSQLIDDKFIIKMTDFLTLLVKGIGNVIDGLGGLKGLLPMLVMAFTSFSPKDTAAGIEKLVAQFHDLKEAISGAATTANDKLKLLTSQLQIGGSVDVANPDVLEMATTLNKQIERRNELRSQGNVIEAATLDTAIRRYAEEFEGALKVARVLERIDQDLGEIQDKEGLGDNALKALRQSNVIDEIDNAKNKDKRGLVLQAKKFNFFDESVFEGLPEDIGQITKKQLNKVINRMKSELAKTAADIEQQFANVDLNASIRDILGDENVNSILENKGIDAFEKVYEKVQEELKGITNETERWETASKIITNELKIEKEASNELGKYMAGAAKAAEGFKFPVPPKTDWSVMATNAIRAASALGTMNGIMDGVNQAFKEFNDGNIKLGDFLTRLTSSATSAVYAFNTLKTAVEAFGVAAKTATTIGLVLIGVLAAIKVFSYAFNKETEDLKELTEEQKKLNEEQKTSIDTTNDLSSAVMNLVSAYEELSKTGGDTFDTLNDLKEQAPQLIEQYEKLADSLGEDWSEDIDNLRIAYEKGIDTGNWDDFIALNEYLQTRTVVANTANAQNQRNTALDTLKTSGKGTLHNGNYQHALWGSEQDYAIGRETLKGFLSGSSGNTVNFDSNNITGYYEALVNTIDALEQAGRANSTYYNNIKKEIAALQPAYKEYIETTKTSLKTFTQDFDRLDWSDSSTDLYQMVFGDMQDYVDPENHKKLLDTVAAMYNITPEDAETILRNSDVTGAGERLYQRWLKELTVNGNEEATNTNLEQIASWYDELPDAYKTFAITLEYDKTKISDPNYLNEMTSEAAEAWRKSQFMTEGENRGFNATEMQEYADYLASIADDADKLTGKNDILADSLKEDSDAALLVARSVMSLNKGVEALSGNWDDWGDILKKSSKESKEYYDALKNTKNAIADMFEVSTEFVENDFIDKHLEDIGKAATGDEEAIENLRQALADDIITNIVTTNNGNLVDGEDPIQLQSIQDKVADLRAWLTDNPIEVGAQMNLDHLETGEDEFLAQCQDIVNSAHMTAEQANAFFDSMGFETTFVTEKQPVQKTGYEQVTESYTRGYSTYPVFDPLTGEQTGTYQVPQIATKTYPGKPYEYTDYVDAIAMTTDADGNPVAPKIESITRKASAPMNNRSSVNKGGSGSSKGGGGSSSKQKTKEPDRYHEINAKIQQNQAEITKLTDLESRLYGQEKLDAMEKEAGFLEEQADLYRQKYEEALRYYEMDKKNLQNNYGATFNPDGTIANYDEWYGKYLAKYNSGKMDDDAWSKFEDAIKKYEESLNLLDETEKAKLDATNKAFDKGLESIEYRLKTINELIDKDIDYLDYMIKQLDKSMYDTADVIALIGKKTEDVYQKTLNEQKAIEDILKHHGGLSDEDIAKFMSGQEDISDIIAKVKDLTETEVKNLIEHQSALIKYNETLIELREEAYEKLGESIDEFNDKIERQKDIISDLDGVMNHYRNIIDIVGKDTLGISDEMLRQMSELSVTAAKGALEISRDELTKNQTMLEALYKRREELLAAGREADARLLDKEIEAQEDRVRQLSEAWASAWEDALHAAEEAFKNSVTLATDAFSQAMAGTIGGLDDLQEAMDMQNTLNDRYLPTYQKIYELNKLTRDVNNAIDNTNNIAGKERLLKLQQDIVKKQEDGAELTEYELGMFQRRLELEQARIAMEEAQNAKNMVRMTRDSEGNWSYTYTADSEAAAQAEQNYEDKLYDLKKYNQDSMKEFEDAMWQAVNEYKNSIADLDLTDEERAKRIKDFQEQWVEHNKDMFQMTLEDAQWILDTYGGVDDLVNTFMETISGKTTQYSDLTDFFNQFNESSQQMMDEVGTSYRTWDEQYKDIFEKAGTSADDFKDKVTEDMKAIEESIVGEDGEGGAVGAAKELGDQMTEQFDGIMENLRKWFEGEDGGYSKMIDSIVSQNEKLYGSIQALLSAYAKLGQVSNFAGDNKDIKVGEVDTGTGQGEIPGFASGGYTGSWGNTGKLAVLHEKELILNQSDTENLLTAVNFVRDLTRMISLNAAEAGNGLGNLFSAGVGQGGGFLDQTVTIHAEFPNATNHNEIEEAFSNLIGLASQYAGRRK